MSTQIIGEPLPSARGVILAPGEATSAATIVNQVATLSLGSRTISADRATTLMIGGLPSSSALSQ